MNVLILARLQFATTAGFHFLFVALTLGLAPLVALMETRYAISGKPVFERMTRFWGQIYVINYALGIVTGLVMEFQFGLAWSGLAHYVGNVFGAPLALETLIAFFAESTFLGMWIFGWHRLPRAVHVTLIWLVTLTAYASAFWIIVANGFMQNPVGYTMRGGVAYLTSFGALLANPNVAVTLPHVLGAGLFTGGVFVAGVSAYHFIRRTREKELFTRSLRLGVVVMALAAFVTVAAGFSQFGVLGQTQPTKTAVLGQHTAEMAQLQQQMVAAHGPGDYIPPTWITTPLAVMINIGEWSMLLGLLFFLPLLFRSWLVRWRFPLYMLVAMVPLPFVAVICGWVVREVGRQPWVVYGELTTRQALSPVGADTVLASFVAFGCVYAVIALVDYLLIVRFVRRGPDGAVLGAPPEAPAEEPALTF